MSASRLSGVVRCYEGKGSSMAEIGLAFDQWPRGLGVWLRCVHGMSDGLCSAPRASAAFLARAGPHVVRASV